MRSGGHPRENEWLCAQILAEYGIPVAATRVATFKDQKVLIVERFDRAPSADGKWIRRLPQEDFCQVFGKSQLQKYENEGGPGITELMKTLEGSKHATQDRLDLLRTQFLFWLLCAIDRQELQRLHRAGRRVPPHPAVRRPLGVSRPRAWSEQAPSPEGEDGDGRVR